MQVVECSDLDEAIDRYAREQNYRLDMIRPADSPAEALLSKNQDQIKLVLAVSEAPGAETHDGWIRGRAGMEYRDLLPGRLGGKVIASQIRLTQGGEVPDYVHYHKIDVQLIYCTRGRIRVVYEDQGPPFWLETGNCVLQPPEIRHRVLECTAGAEVIEISAPAEHETWVDHDIDLPTSRLDPDRDFNGQRFVRHIAAEGTWVPSADDGIEERDTGIQEATRGIADVRVLRRINGPFALRSDIRNGQLIFPLRDGDALSVDLLER